MKEFNFIVTLLFIATITFGQTNFQWEKTDSVTMSKNKIYSLTKMYIGETWKSAQDVIQNDDKEGGVILVKGATLQEFVFMGGIYVYVYKYTVIFRMKDNKYKMTLNNVYCDDMYMKSSGMKGTKIEPFEGDNCPETGTFSHPGLPKKKAILMMSEFKQSLQNLVNSYPEYLKKEINKEDW
jgi:hypothetical protein